MRLCPTVASQPSMRFFPKTAFARTVLLISFILIINQFISYVLVSIYVVKPSMQQLTYLVSKQIQTHQLLLEQALLPERQAEYEVMAGVKRLNEADAIQAGVELGVYYQFVSDELSQLLQKPVEARLSQEADTVFAWVKFAGESAWYQVILSGFDERQFSPILLYLLLIGVLSTLGGALFAGWLNRPLRRLQLAALAMSRGQYFDPLPEKGVSEVVHLTRAFNRMSNELRKIDANRNLLLAGISHDLKTPLTRIRLAIELSSFEDIDSSNEDKSSSNEDVAVFSLKEGVIQDIEDMSQIIDQFTDYVRLANVENMVQVDINELIHEVILASNYTERSHLHAPVQLSVTQKLPKVEVNVIAIKRVLTNLIENARKYGKAPIVVESGWIRAKQQVILRVKDQGLGMDAAEFAEMCIPFTQGDASRGGAGSGLGLAIVERIVRVHQGELSAQQLPAGGFQIEVRLPVI